MGSERNDFEELSYNVKTIRCELDASCVLSEIMDLSSDLLEAYEITMPTVKKLRKRTDSYAFRKLQQFLGGCISKVS